MKKLFTISILTFLAIMLGLFIFSATIQPKTIAAPVGEVKIQGLFIFTNKNRQTPLVLDGRLNKSAQAKCDDMVAKGYYSHIAPNGTDPWLFIQRETGTPSGKYFYGENLNRFDGQPTAKGVVASWMNSPKHKDAIVNKDYHRVGFGVCHSGSATLIVQHFAS